MTVWHKLVVEGRVSMAFEAGQELPEQTFRVTRADLVRYAGASGDFNPIHWSDRIAAGVGLPGVIAHGMFTMALAGRAVAGLGRASATRWSTSACGSPGRCWCPTTTRAPRSRFTAVVEGAPRTESATIDLTATCGGEKVLGAGPGDGQV